MKVTVVVGPVEIRLSGLDVTERQVRRLLADAGQIANRLLDDVDKPDVEEKQPMGFAVVTEVARPPQDEPWTDYGEDV